MCGRRQRYQQANVLELRTIPVLQTGSVHPMMVSEEICTQSRRFPVSALLPLTSESGARADMAAFTLRAIALNRYAIACCPTGSGLSPG